MPRVSGFLLCICLLVFVRSSAASEAAMPSGTLDPTRSAAHLQVSKTTPEYTTISLASPEITMTETQKGYRSYQVFNIEGEPFRPEEGRPCVPQITRFYRIPNTGSAELVLTNTDYEVVEDVEAMPYQEDPNTFNPLAKDDLFYGKDEWYPAEVASMSAPMIMRDFRVVTVTLNPVQINPARHQARIYHNLSAEIVANDQPGENEITHPRRPSGAWRELYRNNIANLDDGALDEATTTPGSILIATTTNTTFRPWADSLAEWKMRKGYKVVVDARTNWSAATLISTIRSDYANWDPPLEFVVLMGDPGSSGVPVSGASDYDHLYALGNTGDDIEDIGVGRLSGSDATTMRCINSKIMAYERNPHMTTTAGAVDTAWYHHAFLYAGLNYSCYGNELLWLWAKEQFIRNTGMDSTWVLTTPGSVNESDVLTAFSRGILFMLWRGAWEFEMQNDIGDRTLPAGRYPICMCITCLAGEYVGSGVSSPAEGFLCAHNGNTPLGGVAAAGTSTAGTHNGCNVVLAAGLAYNIADLKVEHLGTTVAGAKAEMYHSFGDLSTSGFPATFTRYFNLLGDPSLSMWTGTPRILGASYPAALNVGAQEVSLTVTDSSTVNGLQDAVVCLWKRIPDSTWVVGTTDANGHITLPVNVRASGDMMVTVTKRGYKPFLATIPCVQTDVMPMLATHIVDDDNVGGTSGNNDGVMNPGETIDLITYVKNFGSSVTATNITATLTSDNPRVTVLNNSATYADLAPSDSVVGSASFRIQVSSQMQNRESVLLTLNITIDQGQIGSFELACVAERLGYQRHLFPTFAPGATSNLHVVVRNTGTVGMTGVTGVLTSLSPFVSVDVGTATFGDIAAGALDSNNSNFTLTANSLTFRGHQAPMLLVFTSSTGRWTPCNS